MKDKKILSLVLAVMLVLGALPAGLSYAAAEDETAVVFSVVPSRTTALPGSTITYTIYIEPVSHFNGLQFTIGLPDGLTLVEDTKESTFYSQLHADYPDAKFDSSDQLIYLLYCFSPMDFSTTEELDLLSFTCAVSETCTGEQTIALNNVTVLNTANNKLPIVYDPDGSAVTVQTVGNGKAIQLVSGGAAANIAGAQQSNIWFGNYKQSGNKTDGFNVDPIKWRVLSNADGRLFLLADQNLDVVRYNEEYTSVTWADCTLRKWLNGYENHPYDDTFIGSAFSEKELTAVADSAVENANNPSYDTNGGDDTTDKVFLLSIAEAMNTDYGFTDNYDDTDKRVSTNTGYVANGGHTGGSMNGVGEANYWWLRSPGGISGNAASVGDDGSVNDRGHGDDVDYDDVAVRPAFKMNLNSVLFTSAAENGKTGSELTAVSDYTGSDWKLTLLDCRHRRDGIRRKQIARSKQTSG